MAAECSEKHQIKLFGFGIPNSRFYSMEIPYLQVKQSQAVGMVLVHQGDASEAKLNEELKLVVNDRWDFQARQMTSSEYMVVFPDKGTLETFSKIAYLELPIYKLKVKISKSSLDLATFSVLKTCWVQISNVPGVAREVIAAKALASLVGQPLVVDELSLIRDEPIRVKVNCRDLGAIK